MTHPETLALPPRGTAWYYAAAHLAPARRGDVLALQAWWRAVREVPHTVSDPGVAATKLAWWAAQVRALGAVPGSADAAASSPALPPAAATQDAGDARPDHPLLQRLQPALDRAGVDPALLLRAVDAAAAPLQQTRWLDWAGIDAQLAAGHGSVARAAALLAGAPGAQEQIAALGVALARVALLRDLGRDLRRGMVTLPVEALQTHGVRAQQLLARERAPALDALLADAGRRAGAMLDAVELPADTPRDVARCARALRRMARAQLRALAEAQEAVLDARVAPTPLRLLLESWLAQWAG